MDRFRLALTVLLEYNCPLDSVLVLTGGRMKRYGAAVVEDSPNGGRVEGDQQLLWLVDLPELLSQSRNRCYWAYGGLNGLLK